jgi:dethiobiotin synthetase
VSSTILVTGTGTEVGKTWVAARLIEGLRTRAIRVTARKPAQSFDPTQGATDAEVLAAVAGDHPFTVCPAHRWYGVPLAPPMAAAALGKPPFTLADLTSETRSATGDVLIVEGVGGPRSPLSSDGDTVDLADALEPNLVLLVSPSGLGAINSVLLGAAPLQKWPTLVFLNHYQKANPLHDANRSWLVERAGLDVATHPDELVSRVAALAEVVPR